MTKSATVRKGGVREARGDRRDHLEGFFDDVYPDSPSSPTPDPEGKDVKNGRGEKNRGEDGERDMRSASSVHEALRVAEEVDLFGEDEEVGEERAGMASVPYRGVTFLVNVRYRPEELDPWGLGNALLRMARALGLTPFPETLRVVTFPIREGYLAASASLILMESHINASTWPERGLLRLEVSSCRMIERERVERVLAALFGEGNCEVEDHVWVRG